MVDKVNLEHLQTMPGTAELFKSIDTVKDEEQAINYPTEFLNSQDLPGIPKRNLILNKGAPIMLLHNLDPP